MDDPVAAKLAIAREAAEWALPTVSFHAMREAFLRDARAGFGDVVYWSRPPEWRNQAATPDVSARYAYANFDTRDGPIVLEVPPATGADWSGTVRDAWQRPLADVGQAGDDAGRGGRYLLVPPGHGDPLPAGYRPIRAATYDGCAVFRALAEDPSDAAAERAIALARGIRFYPLARAAAPPEQRFVDMSGRLFNGLVRFDATLFSRLSRMVGEEPRQPGDAIVRKRLVILGMNPGHPFAADAATKGLLSGAARELHQDLVRRAASDGERFRDDAHWRLRAASAAGEGSARALAHFLAFAPPDGCGTAAVCLAAFVDGAGRPLAGDRTYRLRLPAAIPARRWSGGGGHPPARRVHPRVARRRTRLARRARAERRRLARSLVRAARAGGRGGELDRDRAGYRLVRDGSLARRRAAGLRPDVGAPGPRSGRGALIGRCATRARAAAGD